MQSKENVKPAIGSISKSLFLQLLSNSVAQLETGLSEESERV